MATPRPRPPVTDIPKSALPSFKRTPEGKPAPLTSRIKGLAAEGAPPPMRGEAAFREKLGVLPIQVNQLEAAVGLLDRVLTGDMRLDELSGVNQWLVKQAAEIYYKGTKTPEQIAKLGPDPDYIPGTLNTLDSLTGRLGPDARLARDPDTPQQLQSAALAHVAQIRREMPGAVSPMERATHLRDAGRLDVSKMQGLWDEAERYRAEYQKLADSGAAERAKDTYEHLATSGAPASEVKAARAEYIKHKYFLDKARHSYVTSRKAYDSLANKYMAGPERLHTAWEAHPSDVSPDESAAYAERLEETAPPEQLGNLKDESERDAYNRQAGQAQEINSIQAAEELNTERQAIEARLLKAEQEGNFSEANRLLGVLEHDLPKEMADVQQRLRAQAPANAKQAAAVAEWIAAKQELFKQIEAAKGRGDTEALARLESEMQDLIEAQPGKGLVREGAVADFDTAGTEPDAVAEVTPYERVRKAEDLLDIAADQRTSNAASIRDAIREQGLDPIGETVATDAAGNPLPEVQRPADPLTLRDNTEGWERSAVRNRRESLGSSAEVRDADARMDTEATIDKHGRPQAPVAAKVRKLSLELNPNDELLDTTPVTVLRMGTRAEGGDPLQSTAKTFVTYEVPTRDPKEPLKSVPVKANSVHAGGYVYLQTEGGGYYRVPVTEGATKAEKLSQSQWATGLREAMGQEGGARPDVTTVNDVNRYFQLDSNRQSALNRNLGDLLEDRMYSEDVNAGDAAIGRTRPESRADWAQRKRDRKEKARYERTKAWNKTPILRGLQETFFSKQLAEQAFHPPGKALPEPGVKMPAPMRLLGNNPISDDAFESALLRTNNRLANGEPVEPADIAIIIDYRSAHPEDFENMVGMIRNSTESRNADYLLAQAHVARHRGEGLAYEDLIKRFGDADRNVLDEKRLFSYLNDYSRVRNDLARLLEQDDLAPTPANLRAAELIESTYEAPGSPSDPPIDLERLENMRAAAYEQYERAIPDERPLGIDPSSPRLMEFQRNLQGEMGKRGLKNIGILGHLESRSGASRNLGAINKLRENAFLLEDPTLDPLKRRALEAENQRIIAKLETSFDSRVSQGEAAALQALRFAEAPDRHRASSGIEMDPDEAMREGLAEVGEAMRRGDQAEFSSPSEAPGGGPDTSPGFTEGFASMLGNPAQREYLAGTMFGDPNRNSNPRRMMYRLYLRSGLGRSSSPRMYPFKQTGVGEPTPYLSTGKIPVNDINRAFDKIDSISDELAVQRLAAIGGGSRSANSGKRVAQLESELAYWQNELDQIPGFRKNYDDFQAMLDDALTTDKLQPASDVMESPEVRAKVRDYQPAKNPTIGEKMRALRATLVDSFTAPRELELPSSKSARQETEFNLSQLRASYNNARNIDYDRGRLLLDAFRQSPDADIRDIHRMRRKALLRPHLFDLLPLEFFASNDGAKHFLKTKRWFTEATKEDALRHIREARRWAQAKANGGKVPLTADQQLGGGYSPSDQVPPPAPGQLGRKEGVDPPPIADTPSNPYVDFDRELENLERWWMSQDTVTDTYTGGANLGDAAKDFKVNRTATGSLMPLTKKPDLVKFAESKIEQPVFVDPNNAEAIEAMRLLTGESYIGENAFVRDPIPENPSAIGDIERILQDTEVMRLGDFAADDPDLLQRLQKAAAHPDTDTEDAVKFTRAAELIAPMQEQKAALRRRMYEGQPIGPDSFSMGKPMRRGEKLVIPVHVAIPEAKGPHGIVEGYKQTIYIPASYEPIATPGGQTTSFSIDPKTGTFRRAAFAEPEAPVPEFSEGAKIIGSKAPLTKDLVLPDSAYVPGKGNETVLRVTPPPAPSRMRRLVDAASSVVPSGRTTARVAGVAGAAGLGVAAATALNDYLNPVEVPPVDQNRIRRLVEESVADQVYTNDPAKHKKVMTTQVPLAGKIGL